MPNSFSRFLSEEDLVKVRRQYLAELEKATGDVPAEEPGAESGQDGSKETTG